MSRLVCVSGQVFLPEARHVPAVAECVRTALEQQGGVWFGWGGSIVQSRDREGGEAVQAREAGDITYLTIPLLER
jgi:hypothetical protein